MSGGGMQLDGNQQKFKEKKEFVIDTKKKSELLKDENETNGYNLIVEPPKLLKKPNNLSSRHFVREPQIGHSFIQSLHFIL